MSDSQKAKPCKPDRDPPATAQAPVADAPAIESGPVAQHDEANSGPPPGEVARPVAAVEAQATAVAPGPAGAEPARADPESMAPQQATTVPPAAAARPAAQVIDLDAIRADERKATLAYVAEVHDLCAIAGRGDLAAGFVAKAAPVAQVRRALLEARAAEDEVTAIRSQVRPATVEPAQPAIDTQAIYAARNQNVR
jgi:hypothetical protein